VLPNSDGVPSINESTAVSGRSQLGEGAFGKGDGAFRVLLPNPLVLPPSVQVLFASATFWALDDGGNEPAKFKLCINLCLIFKCFS
jgi:hypothetical protein